MEYSDFSYLLDELSIVQSANSYTFSEDFLLWAATGPYQIEDTWKED
jgi:hypothetical protein